MRSFVSLAVLAAVCTSYGQIFTDDFNRPDDVNLGANWDVIGTGSATRVIGNEAGNVASANNLSLVKTTMFSAAYDLHKVSAFVRTTDASATLAYAAIALAHDGTTTSGHGLFIKVQRQGGSLGGFNTMGIYTAVGTSNTAAVTGGAAFFTIPEFTSGNLVAWFSNPTTVEVGIDTDLNGSYEQQYTRTLGGAFVAGTRAGVGVYGTLARLDNFRAEAVPEPATLAALGLGMAALIRRRKAK